MGKKHMIPPCLLRNTLVPETKMATFANSLDLDEVAQYEPPHLDQYCVRSSFRGSGSCVGDNKLDCQSRGRTIHPPLLCFFG